MNTDRSDLKLKGEALKGKRILNLGSGDDDYGTDRLDVVKRPNVTKVADISKGLPYRDDYFDEIYCKCIFEHLENPNKILAECKRVMKPGGIIKIITDHGGFVFWHYNRIGRPHGDYCYDGKGLNTDDVHFAFYTPEHLRNHFNKVGLEIVKCKLASHGEVTKTNTKTIMIQKVMSIFLGKFGWPCVLAIGRKPLKQRRRRTFRVTW